MKHLKAFLFVVIILISANVFGQPIRSSPFHRLAPNTAAKMYGAVINGKGIRATAFRFTAALASFDAVNNKVLTGIGYGLNNMHLITDSTGNSHWYTDFTANISVYAAGNVAPTYLNGNTNIIGFGPSIGILNKLVNIGYVFYPALNGGTTKSGVIVGIYLPLN